MPRKSSQVVFYNESREGSRWPQIILLIHCNLSLNSKFAVSSYNALTCSIQKVSRSCLLSRAQQRSWQNCQMSTSALLLRFFELCCIFFTRIIFTVISQDNSFNSFGQGWKPAAHGPNTARVNIGMDRIRIFVTQFTVQNHVKTKLCDKQVLKMGCNKKTPSLIVR